jgi:hypothetical protein
MIGPGGFCFGYHRLSNDNADRATRFKRDQRRIGGGYCVRAMLPDATLDRIEGFATEGEAGRWIRNESAAWLHTRRIV